MDKSAVLDHPIFQDDRSARELLERLRWPRGVPVCVLNPEHRGVIKVEGRSRRESLYVCRQCRSDGSPSQFTVTVGTALHRSKLPLSMWMRATFLLSTHRGHAVTVQELHQQLGITYVTAWKLWQRIKKRAKRYRGHTGRQGGDQSGFGTTVRKVMPEKLRRASEETIRSTGAIAAVVWPRSKRTSDRSIRSQLNAMELLLRLLLTSPKSK